MATGLKYDPYMNPQGFMDDIVSQMRESFDRQVHEINMSAVTKVNAKLQEVDEALAALNDVKAQREQAIRMECLRLATGMAGGFDAGQAARMAGSLADLVLNGKPGEVTSATGFKAFTHHLDDQVRRAAAAEGVLVDDPR